MKLVLSLVLRIVLLAIIGIGATLLSQYFFDLAWPGWIAGAAAGGILGLYWAIKDSSPREKPQPIDPEEVWDRR